MFKNKKNSSFVIKPKSLQKNEYVFYSHLGLGDQIILFGAINKLSNQNNKLHVVSYSKFKTSIDYLYRGIENVQIFYLPKSLDSSLQDHPLIDTYVKEYASNLNLEILKIGYENINKRLPFYVGLYKQLQINYKTSYTNFFLESNEELNQKISHHLLEVNDIKRSGFTLIHNEHSTGVKELKNIPTQETIYVKKETDPFGNIFLYENLIKDAGEIHCINSSFIHFVDRVNTEAKLYYHNLVGSTLKLKKNWEIIDY